MAEKNSSHDDHVEVASEQRHRQHDLDHEVDEMIHQQDGALLIDIGAKGAEAGARGAVKLAKDGHTVLVPQPSDDPNDPLNWSWFKKHSILVTIAVAAYMADFIGGSAVPCLIPQAAQWHLTPTHVNYSGNLSIILAGIGGVMAIPLLYFWGRAPVIFWAILIGVCLQIGITLSPDFTTYYATKALQGLLNQAALTAGLSYIQDMFFFHEHCRKIGIWASIFLIAPYCGPLFGNFIIYKTGDWRIVQWLVFAVGGFDLVLIVLFLDESFYRRDIPASDQPSRGSRLLRATGIWQIRVHRGYFNTFGQACRRVIVVAAKPIMLLVFFYYMAVFMWLVGVNQTSSILFSTPRSEGGYGFNQKALGFLFFAPILGISTGEVFGHFFNDWIATRGIRSHGGIFVPEYRLPTVYVGGAVCVPGLVIIGEALTHHWSWVAIAFGWGMFAFGCMLSSVAITAYTLDIYPSASGEVSALINLARVGGGFAVGYFQLQWGVHAGFDVSFGIQAGVIAAATLLIIPVLQLFGARLRRIRGRLPY